MKLNEIFNRRRKADFQPMSLYPSDFTVKTSAPIGRAVPIRTIDLAQGNTWDCSASGVARFMTMNAPVMTDYELTLCAYFVPYTSYDDFFKSTFMRNSIYSNSNNVTAQSKILHAREFFDGATKASDRVHPILVTFDTLSGTKLIGSLADHLGYYIGSNIDLVGATLNFGVHGGSKTALPIENFNNVDYRSFTYDQGEQLYVYANKVWAKASAASPTIIALPLDVYAYAFAKGINVSNYNAVILDEFDDLTRSTDNILMSVLQEYLYGIANPVKHITDPSTYSKKFDWSYWFGDTTVSDVLDSYWNYLTDFYRFSNGNVASFSANVIRWLSYMRVYSDYFLRDDYIDAEDFRDMIGEAYLQKALNPTWTLGDIFQSSNNASLKSKGLYKLNGRNDLKFFADYLANGSCLPVPYAHDYFTGVQLETTINNGDPFGNFKTTNGGATTPLGSNIGELRFNRIYAKFKDLVSRFGFSYKNNTGAIYGHTPSDDTLCRSQALGKKFFTVNVGSVMQTSASTPDSPMGSFVGVGATGVNTDSWHWTADENGQILIMAWIRPKNVANVHGCDRSIFKDNYYDYLLPQFGGIDYQDLYAGEVYPNAESNKKNRFAYVERYWEYMMVNDVVNGELRNKYRPWTADRFLEDRPSVSFHGSPSFFYMADKNLHIPFIDQINDPVILNLKFNGTVTRQLPEHMVTEF